MSTPGHNSVSAEHLKSFVQRIQSLHDDKAAISADLADIYAEAKGAGFDKKALRHLVKLMAMDKADRDEADTILALYRDAAGIA